MGHRTVSTLKDMDKPQVFNNQQIQGEHFVSFDCDYVGCDFNTANIHIINGAKARFIGCTFCHSNINHSVGVEEYKSPIAVYIQNCLFTGGDSGGSGIPYGSLQYKISHPVVSILEEVFGEMPSVAFPCKCGKGKYRTRLNNVIVHLNDKEKWSRERIADWIETLDCDLTMKALSKGD